MLQYLHFNPCENFNFTFNLWIAGTVFYEKLTELKMSGSFLVNPLKVYKWSGLNLLSGYGYRWGV